MLLIQAPCILLFSGREFWGSSVNIDVDNRLAKGLLDGIFGSIFGDANVFCMVTMASKRLKYATSLSLIGRHLIQKQHMDCEKLYTLIINRSRDTCMFYTKLASSSAHHEYYTFLCSRINPEDRIISLSNNFPKFEIPKYV